ncbi:disulfide oxidoreductase [Ornithinibacillus sp. 179-J 7C1 HS]|uniref:disulfide oxidoreductase n=1 Tax=Ornithinibacillus sp. 179-J 7C1 HS TaxID=3142384 RepID=UPI0039A0957A
MSKKYLFAFIISIIATIGSLYFSEIRGFIPCKLCWIQRIFMYPIPILLGIGLLTKDKGISKYILSLSIPGLFIALYHFAIQKLPINPKPCDVNVQCTSEYINWLGFITIPLLSLVAFFLISILLFSIKSEKNK